MREMINIKAANKTFLFFHTTLKYILSGIQIGNTADLLQLKPNEGFEVKCCRMSFVVLSACAKAGALLPDKPRRTTNSVFYRWRIIAVLKRRLSRLRRHSHQPDASFPAAC